MESGQHQEDRFFNFMRYSNKLVQALQERRGIISLEDIPITESAFGKQVVILMPEALQISDGTAKASLAGRLSVNALGALQVSTLQLVRLLAAVIVIITTYLVSFCFSCKLLHADVAAVK